MSNELTLALWMQYVANRHPDTRERIIDSYMEFAKTLAAKLYAQRQIQELEFNDYLQYARVGLLDAIDRFDPQQGVDFKTYASKRIIGEILDGVEKSCELQQQISFRAKIRKERLQSLANQSDSAISLFEQLAELTIGLAIGFMLEESNMYQSDENPKSTAGPYEQMEMVDLCKSMRNLVERLPEQQRNVVKYHYYHSESFEDIGQKFGLSRSRISQVHKSALDQLKLYWEMDSTFDMSV